MARQRFIHPEIWTDEKFALLKPIERLFFIGLFSNCDDEGRICASPAYLRATIFPFDRISLKKVKQIRDSVVQNFPSVLLYTCGENEYLQLQNFKKYQKPKYPRPSRIPPPPGAEGSFQEMSPEIFPQKGTENCLEAEEEFPLGSGCDLDQGSGSGCGRGQGEQPAAAAALERDLAGELGRTLSEIERAQVSAWLRAHPPEVVREALRIAVLRGKPRLDYISGILASWRRSGFATLDEVRSFEGEAGQGGEARASAAAEVEEGARAALRYFSLTRGGEPTPEALEEFFAEHDYGPEVRARAFELAGARARGP